MFSLLNIQRIISFASISLPAVNAAPASFFGGNIDRRAISTLSTVDIQSFAPFSQFAAAAYCDTSKLREWTCGSFCDGNGGFQPSLAGGNGNDVQQFFVGYWPEEGRIIVSYQGTDPLKFQSVLTDLDFLPDQMDASLFPGAPSDAQVHGGFQDAYKDSASAIFAEVKNLMSIHGTNKITITGHSLGGAISQLSAVSMQLRIPEADISVVTFGAPRVGNPIFAEFVNTKISNYKRINNKKDLVPILPGRSLGFQHPAGEIHLLGSGSAVACDGHDSTDNQCQIDTVPSILSGNVLDHLGPYEGILMASFLC